MNRLTRAFPPSDRWQAFERWLVRRLAFRVRHDRAPRLGLLVPVLFLASVTLWTLTAIPGLPPTTDMMRELTPWAGALALVAQGIYLIRVASRVVGVCHLYAESQNDRQGIREVRRALLPVLNILAGVLLFSGVYAYQSLDAISESASVRVTRLLWIMTTGGLMLSIVFGELVMRFAEIAERIMSSAEGRADAAE